MKTGVWISLILLALTIGLGVWSGEEVRALSEEYAASAEELRTLAEAENWAGAEAALQKCQSVWKQKVPWLQTLINHDDVDAVTTALKKIEAGISSRELSLCLEACAELGEHAEHLYHRDALTLGNVSKHRRCLELTRGHSMKKSPTQSRERVKGRSPLQSPETASLVTSAEAKSFTFPTAR
ncbi:MAG: DUF4363 family protein [Christensenellales bacterium]